MKVVYLLIVLFLSLNFLWYVLHEGRFWLQVSACLVLVMLLLRLFLVK